ncbi:MAG: phosphodiester glycosidase family protein [Bacilli bacterium]|nr:phosphodiester glycosidase family protein [Bacilli bacterium]
MKKNKKTKLEKKKEKLENKLRVKENEILKSKKIIILSLITIPFLFVLFVISRHSNRLVTKPLAIIVTILLIMFLICLLYGIYKYIKEFKHHKMKYIQSKIKKVLLTIFLIVYISGCTTFLILLYSPYEAFRNWLITTAMQTMTHKYLCQWFYSDEEINKVMSNNYIIESEEDTNLDLINKEEEVTYANEYEKTVLQRDKDATYKMVKFEVNGCNAYLAIVYDPADVSVAVSKYVHKSGQYVVDMAKENNAVVAINGGGFVDPNYNGSGGNPIGVTYSNGKLITNNTYGMSGTGGMIGFTSDNKLVLKRQATAAQAEALGVRDSVSHGPFLIVNGKPAFIKGNGGWGYAARSAIGQRADGIVLLLVVDSNATRTKGADMVNLTEIMQNYGAVNAANLDGGTSSVMVENGELISNPIDGALRHRTRPIATSIIVKEHKKQVE